MGKARSKKTPPIKLPPQRDDAPRRASKVPDQDASSARICWRFNLADTEGSWAITPVSWPEVIGHLRQFESMTVHDLFAAGGDMGKDYSLERGFPQDEANRRWQALGLDDQDRVSRLRHGGLIRIYGLRVGNVFHVLWWDPEHEIWPSRSRWSGGRWILP